MAASNRADVVTPGARPPRSDRLDTWKEIAAHLNRAVRTVQRWEQDEGLPVHRHQHDRQGSIYAFKSEIDAWWAARSDVLERDLDHAAERQEKSPVEVTPLATDPTAVRPAPSPARFFSPRRPVALAAAGLVAVAATGSLLLWRARTSGGNRARHAPHRFLVAEFENRTGEPALTGRVNDALQEQLGASRFAHVVPPDQTAEYLRLMKKPAFTHIDATIGREISLRDGAIDAVVTGTLDRAGAGYVATVRFLTPDNAAVVDTFAAEGASLDSLVSAVRRKSVDVEQTLDEQLPHHQRRDPVPKVTTVSLHALQLYGQAVELMDQVPPGTAPAFALLTQAVKLDPDFASAQILAAWALFNAGQPSNRFLPYADRAFATVEGTTDEERYYILGSYYQLRHDPEKAVSAYEALLRLDPNNYWALGNLGRLYRAMGYHDAEVEVRNRQLEVRPGQFWGAYRLAEALLLKGEVNELHEPAALAASLAKAPQVDSSQLQARRAWFDILPVCEAWLQDDVVRSARIAKELEDTLSRRETSGRDALITALGYSYLTLGQRHAADRILGRLPKTAGRLYHLAVVSSQFDGPDQVRKSLDDAGDAVNGRAVTVGVPMLATGTLLRADDLVAGWVKDRAGDEPDARLLRGQLALMQGHTNEARALLTSSIDLREDRSGTAALSASEWLAKAWRMDGDWQQAIRVLEDASQNRFKSCLFPTDSAHVWLRMRVDLAELYRHVGRSAETATIDRQVRNLLKAADQNHPLLARLDAAANATTTAAAYPH